MRRLKNALLSGCEFLYLVYYFWRKRRFPLRDAIKLAGLTL